MQSMLLINSMLSLARYIDRVKSVAGSDTKSSTMSPGNRNSVEKCLAKEDIEPPQKHVTVLDGGFATQLSCHVDEPIDGDVLWSARFLATNPQAVIATHLDFLRGKY